MIPPRAIQEEDIVPGEYRVIEGKGTAIGPSAELGEMTGTLNKGATVEIVEIERIEKRIRGRLADGGWISIRNTDTGFMWAAPPHRDGDVPLREFVMAFLRNGTNMQLTDETREYLKDREAVPKPAEELIRLQRAEWEPLGVDADLGCRCIEAAENLYPGDTALIDARTIF